MRRCRTFCSPAGNRHASRVARLPDGIEKRLSLAGEIDDLTVARDFTLLERVIAVDGAAFTVLSRGAGTDRLSAPQVSPRQTVRNTRDAHQRHPARSARAPVSAAIPSCSAAVTASAHVSCVEVCTLSHQGLLSSVSVFTTKRVMYEKRPS